MHEADRRSALARVAARLGTRDSFGRPRGATRKRTTARWRGEAGQTLVLVVLALPVMLGMAAIVIDVGNLFVEKRSMQQAADAAALAAAQRLPGVACDSTCQSEVATLAGNYSGENLVSGGTGPLPPCSPGITSNCYRVLGADRVEVKLTKSVSTFFGGLIGKSSYIVGARAVGSRFDYTTTTPGSTDITPSSTSITPGSTDITPGGTDITPGSTVITPGNTVITPGSTVVNVTTTGGSNIAIFARGQECSSFFVPGDHVHVTGIATNGGVGNINGDHNIVDAISMQKPFYNGGSQGCDYTGKVNNGVNGNVIPVPPTFRTPPNSGTDAPILADWPVPWPNLTTQLFRVPNSHCLLSTDTLTTKALQSGKATLTTSAPHCLEVGKSVTVASSDFRFNGIYTVTALTGTTFSYAKSLSTFVRNVSTKALTNNVATLTTTAVHGLRVGDIVTIAGVGVDSNFNGTYTVTAVPSTTKLSYAKSIPPVALNVTTKALAAGVATLTTSVAHNLAVGASVTVAIDDARFDGTFTVTAVPSTTTFRYTPTPVALTVINKAVTAGVATLTTGAAHGLSVGNTVTVAIGDKRFDGTYTVTAVPTTTTFSYASPSVAATSWAVVGNVAKLTATTPPHGLAVGDSVTVSGFGQVYLNGTFTLTAVTASTFSYALIHANASGNNNGSARIWTVASTAAAGTATFVTGAATGTVTVPGFVTSTASGGTVTFTGDVASTATGGTATFGAVANATIANGWTATHPPGIYYIDAGVTSLADTITVTASNTTFNGYSFVAPMIDVTGANNSFTYYSGAPQQTALWGYCGMLGTAVCGDGVHMAGGNIDGSDVTGSMFCGPIDPPAGGATPKCWYGGSGATPSTFTGVMEGWQIEYTISNATFNGGGPGIGSTTSTTITTTPGSSATTPATTTTTPGSTTTYPGSTTPTPGSTTTYPGSTTTNPDTVSTVGTGSNLDE